MVTEFRISNKADLMSRWVTRISVSHRGNRTLGFQEEI
jgi:hypothetical protein